MIEIKPKDSPQNSITRAFTRAVISTAVFLLACVFGEGLGGSWGSNGACWKYLGCTSGFFGYDAIEHFLFGITAVFILVWIFKKFPQYSVLQDKVWKNILIIIALVVLTGVIWEFLECAHDYFRIDILHQALLNFRLHINHLDQPTNLDTMGDLFFNIVGAFVALFSGAINV